MTVTPWRVIGRGLAFRCPNCGGRTLFAHWLKMHERCSRCGLQFEVDEGFFLGSMVLNYAATGLLVIAIVVAAALQMVSVLEGVIAAVVVCTAFPFIFFPASKSLWLMIYYASLPHELPANRNNAET